MTDAELLAAEQRVLTGLRLCHAIEEQLTSRMVLPNGRRWGRAMIHGGYGARESLSVDIQANERVFEFRGKRNLTRASFAGIERALAGIEEARPYAEKKTRP
jgi:hypothetical protein